MDKKINSFIVYKHVSPSKKVYIGITSQKAKKRWKYGDGYKHNNRFFNAIKKYGWSKFEHIILFSDLTEEEAKQKEIELISFYNSTDRKHGYNISPGGDIVPEESIEKIRKTRKRNGTSKKERERMLSVWSDPNKRQYILERMQNKPRTEEQKQRMRNANYNRGKHLSETTKAKLRFKMSQKTGEQSIRGRRVAQIDPKTLSVIKIYLTARIASNEIGAKPISRIASLCSGRGRDKSHFYKGFYWLWESEFEEKIKTLEKLMPDQINSNGKRIRRPEENPMYGTHVSEKQKKIISDAHRKEVVCLDNGMVFESLKSAANWCNLKFPELISRCIKSNNPNKTAGGYHWKYCNKK